MLYDSITTSFAEAEIINFHQIESSTALQVTICKQILNIAFNSKHKSLSNRFPGSKFSPDNRQIQN
jgi:hypothetical protein